MKTVNQDQIELVGVPFEENVGCHRMNLAPWDRSTGRGVDTYPLGTPYPVEASTEPSPDLQVATVTPGANQVVDDVVALPEAPGQ